MWQIASDHSVPFPNLWLTINNKQNPRPSNCINSDTAWWETVSWMGDDLRFTAWNLLILSNWLSPVRKSSSLHQSPPPPHSLSTSSATINIISAGGGRWILAALLPWEAHQRPLPFLLWAEFHTLDPIFLVTGVWWLKCIKNGGSATKRWWFSELSPQLKRGDKFKSLQEGCHENNTRKEEEEEDRGRLMLVDGGQVEAGGVGVCVCVCVCKVTLM